MLGVVQLDFLAACQGNFLVELSGYPGMLEGSLGIVPLDLADVAQIDYEVLGKLAHVSRVRPLFRLDVGHLVLERLRVVGHDPSLNKQRMKAHQHGVESDPCCVYVDLLAVLLARYLFRCHVQGCSNLVFMRIFDAHALLGRKPEVYYFKLLLGVLAAGS